VSLKIEFSLISHRKCPKSAPIITPLFVHVFALTSDFDRSKRCQLRLHLYGIKKWFAACKSAVKSLAQWQCKNLRVITEAGWMQPTNAETAFLFKPKRLAD
jgi:hypothetical protein